MRLAALVDGRTLRPARDDVGLHARGDLGVAPAGARLQQLRLVVVDDRVVGLLDEGAEFLAVEQRHRLARIEDEGNALLGEFARVLQHAFAAVRRDDAEGDAFDVLHVVFVRIEHRARMEGGDLVVVHVRGDEALRREQVVVDEHVVEADAAALQMLAIRAEILADRAERDRIVAEQLQVVGDVARAAAELAAHARHEERHVEDVHLVREDVVPELVREDHDRVVGKPQISADIGNFRRVSRSAASAARKADSLTCRADRSRPAVRGRTLADEPGTRFRASAASADRCADARKSARKSLLLTSLALRAH
jgi:DNA-binding protein YbaB